jgi:hypothetical protein
MDTNNSASPQVLVGTSALSITGTAVTTTAHHISTIDANQLALWVTISSGCITMVFTLGAMLIGLIHFFQWLHPRFPAVGSLVPHPKIIAAALLILAAAMVIGIIRLFTL